MNRRIDGMVVAITGASSGIGKALAEELDRRGARLVLAARRLRRLRRLNDRLGDRHVVLRADVSDADDCRRMVEAAYERFGRLDTLVCNAGYGLIRPASMTTPDQFLEIFRTNVLGTAQCVGAAVPRLLRQPQRDGWRGQIVIVSSAAARRGLPDMGAYAATKAAQLSFVESLRVELRDGGVAVTSIHPVTTGREFFRSAMRVSGVRPPRPCGIEVSQTPEQVAQVLAQAIRRPRPEVWTHRRTEILMKLAVFAPRIADWVLSKRRPGRPTGDRRYSVSLTGSGA